ncbi:flagellar hook-associated protein FlgK [Acidithiobacillus caldus]
MSLNGILQVGLSGVLASENALQTVSNNIANENTPGYVSEVANLATNPSQPTTFPGGLGEGVQTASISRNFSNFAQTQFMNATSLAAASSGEVNTLQQLSSLFPVTSGQSGLSSAISNFYAAFQTLSTNPSSIPDRQSVLSQAQSLTAQYQNSINTIASVKNGLVQQMQQSVGTINALSSQLAKINQSILATPSGSSIPNSLLDSQAAALDQLSEQIGINTITTSEGTLIVTTKSGATLVDGSQSMKLAVQVGGQYQQPGQGGIVYQPTGQNLTTKITGGALGGALSAQARVNQIQLQLGLLAQGIVAVTNSQQAKGVDLNGNFGAPIFSVQGPEVFPADTNQGNALITASVTDLSSVPPTTFTLEYNGSQWNVINDANGTLQTLTASSGGTLQFGGMTVQVSGTAAAGDSFLLDPAGATAGSFQTVMTDPNQVAAAFPYVASPGTVSASGGLVNNNIGTESLSSGTVVSTGNYGSGVAVVPSGIAPQSLSLTFTSATQYNISTSGGVVIASGSWGGPGSTAVVIPYPSNGSASGSAMSFSWDGGQPVAGDVFTFSSGAPGDNANAVAMAQVSDQPVLQNGSINQSVADLSSTYGNMTQVANQSQSAANAVLSQATTALSNISGVNLNEEAAQVVNYTQAYQAASAIIQTTNTLFQSLLQAV